MSLFVITLKPQQLQENLLAQTLILNYLNEPENETLASQVNDFRQRTAENEKYFQEVSTIWYAAEKTKTLTQVDFNASVTKFRARLTDHMEDIPKKSIGLLGKVAAIIVICAAVFWMYPKQVSVQYLVKQTTDQIDSLILNDGTKIMLAKNTTISYPERFQGETREVSLQHGQAFFHVSKDAAHPFSVIIGQSKVTVLGTSFDILFSNEFINLSVATGKVMFSPNQVSQSSVLTAGQALEYSLIKNQVKWVDGVNADSWITKELVFIDMPLERVCEELSKCYGVKIVVADQRIHAKKFNARFKGNSLEEILSVLERTYNIKIKKNTNDLITITNL